jgi:hypothetical protein
MKYILKHETENKFLIIGDEEYHGIETSSLKEATRFPTEAAAIVALEDSDFQSDYCPEPVRK